MRTQLVSIVHRPPWYDGPLVCVERLPVSVIDAAIDDGEDGREALMDLVAERQYPRLWLAENGTVDYRPYRAEGPA